MGNNKVALVTGASRGIGKACALELANAGYDVIVNYAGNEEAANSVVSEIKAKGVNSEAVKFDVSNKKNVEDAINDIISKYEKIDVLVNNAGITRDGLFIRMSEENWNDVINTNLTGMFNVANPVVKLMMKQRSGSIVNLSSIVGINGNAGQANYAAAKAGVIGMTKSLAKELGSRGIRVNAVVSELGGEKIDIIPWSENPLEFIAKALSPAKVLKVYSLEEENSARAIVPDDKLSLAIGRDGQNARLAVKLTGWKIDVKSESSQQKEELEDEE